MRKKTSVKLKAKTADSECCRVLCDHASKKKKKMAKAEEIMARYRKMLRALSK